MAGLSYLPGAQFTTWGPDLSGLTRESYQDRNDIGNGK